MSRAKPPRAIDKHGICQYNRRFELTYEEPMKSFVSILLLSSFLSVQVRAADSQWTLFKNDFGFSFSYPSDWELNPSESEDPPEQAPELLLQGPKSAIDTRTQSVRIDLGCEPGGKREPRDMALRALLGRPGITPLDKGPLKIAGAPAYEVVFLDPPLGSDTVIRHIEVKHDTTLCTIEISESGARGAPIHTQQGWKFRDITDKILSSFKFIKAKRKFHIIK